MVILWSRLSSMKTDLYRLDIAQARNKLLKKEISAPELVRSCLERIHQLNPKLNAFTYINDSAIKQSEHIDSSLPLAGIPIALKDNILSAGLPATASSLVLENYISQYDSTVAKKLKDAGAIIIGKTNMDAWAHGSSTETSDFGPTLNPHNTDYLPGGSSGGSAAAVCADMCIAAIGTETAGSIRQPASWCGITGFKPTYGRVSRYGIIAMASSTDSPGPMTKNVSDAALLLQIIAGNDSQDATSSPSDAPDYSKDINSKISGLRIGLAKDYLLPGMSGQVISLIRNAAADFEKFGASVEEISLMDPQYSIGVYTILQRSEVSSNLARYDGIRFGKGRDSFAEEAKRRIMLGTYALSAGYYDQFYRKAQQVRTLIVKDFEKAFKNVDLIIGPTSPGTALPVGASKNQPMFGEMEDVLAEPSSIAGLPGVSVPCGFIKGLPVGLQIISSAFNEKKILQAAYAYQSITNWHKTKPQL